jgi:GntR family transcriptional repressor for pyruvate dehydrogenase complex
MLPSYEAGSPNELFRVLDRDATLAERVTEQIKTYIVDGQLQPGDRMPPERELARQFGVSRTVVREAVRALMAQGLLEVRAGSGSVVRNPSAESVAQSMALFLRVGRDNFDYHKVIEVRRLLEIEIAGLAAQRRSVEDLDALTALLEEMPTVGDNRDEWLKNDIAFHAVLAQATKNELFALLLDSITDIMVTVRRLGFTVPDAAARAFKYHSAIFEQVQRGDQAGAREAMRDHLAEAEATMRTALALQAAQNSGQHG